MTASGHFCKAYGMLVSLADWLPAEPFDYHWGARGFIGCNRLACRRCLQAVRGIGGKRKADGEVLSVQDLVRDGTEARGLVPALKARVYHCACTWQEVHSAESLDPAEERWPPHLDVQPPPWACTGHPPLLLPTVLDGVALSTGMPLAGLVDDVLAGRQPQALPWQGTSLARQPGLWLVRLAAVAPPLRRAVASEIAIRAAMGDAGAREAAREIERLPADPQ